MTDDDERLGLPLRFWALSAILLKMGIGWDGPHHSFIGTFTLHGPLYLQYLLAVLFTLLELNSLWLHFRLHPHA
jgi:hypothetical protein